MVVLDDDYDDDDDDNDVTHTNQPTKRQTDWNICILIFNNGHP